MKAGSRRIIPVEARHAHPTPRNHSPPKRTVSCRQRFLLVHQRLIVLFLLIELAVHNHLPLLMLRHQRKDDRIGTHPAQQPEHSAHPVGAHGINERLGNDNSRAGEHIPEEVVDGNAA
jgi:hypothetical protein